MAEIKTKSLPKFSEKKFAARIKFMFRQFSHSRSEVQPSKLWQALNKDSNQSINSHGYRNFKKTLGRHYFANIPWYLMNKQILFLLIHVSPISIIYALYQSFTLKKHPYYRWIDSVSYNFITYLLWIYALKQDKNNTLSTFEEPKIGGTPEIRYHGKLISQDIANSFLEFKSIFDHTVKKDEIKTIAELGAGSGRDAYFFIKSLPQLKKYLIIDIPPALAVSEQYLTDVFPEKKIFSYRPFAKFSDIKKEFDQSDILFFLPNQIELLPNSYVDLFINISSLHEMRMDQINYYFQEIRRLTKLKKYFYLKEWKDSYVTFEDVHIKTEDYPIKPYWKTIYLRTPKVQTKFFESLLTLQKK